MDFGALPPEINSARMYAGPGSESMLAAAAGLERVGRRIAFRGILLRVGDFGIDRRVWMGPSSTAMEAAATPMWRG